MRSNSAGFVFFALLLAAVPAVAGGPGFRTPHLLEEHYSKYGPEFGPVTRIQYLRMAQRLRDSKPGANVLESMRPDRSTAKFDRKRGWFVSYDNDGTIRTFFVPNEGIRFFERQTRATTPPGQ